MKWTKSFVKMINDHLEYLDTGAQGSKNRALSVQEVVTNNACSRFMVEYPTIYSFSVAHLGDDDWCPQAQWEFILYGTGAVFFRYMTDEEAIAMRAADAVITAIDSFEDLLKTEGDNR